MSTAKIIVYDYSVLPKIKSMGQTRMNRLNFGRAWSITGLAI
jgi:hypothetical protein